MQNGFTNSHDTRIFKLLNSTSKSCRKYFQISTNVHTFYGTREKY